MGWTEIALIGAVVIIGGGWLLLRGAGDVINQGLNEKCPACAANPNSSKCQACLDKLFNKIGAAWDSSYAYAYAAGYGQDFYS